MTGSSAQALQRCSHVPCRPVYVRRDPLPPTVGSERGEATGLPRGLAAHDGRRFRRPDAVAVRAAELLFVRVARRVRIVDVAPLPLVLYNILRLGDLCFLQLVDQRSERHRRSFPRLWRDGAVGRGSRAGRMRSLAPSTGTVKYPRDVGSLGARGGATSGRRYRTAAGLEPTAVEAGTPGGIRTPDPVVRSHVLWSAELRAREDDHASANGVASAAS